MRLIAALASVILAALTGLLIKLTVPRARLPYENGRHFDPTDSVVYDEGAVTVYGLLVAIFALVTAIMIWGTVRLWGRG